MRDFFSKIGMVLLSSFCFLCITMFVLLMCVPMTDNSPTISGFVGFLLWCFLMFILIKGHPVVSLIISVIIATVFTIYNSSFTRSDSLFKEIFGPIIVVAFLYFLFKSEHNRNVKYSNDIKEGKCPRCGAKLVYVPEKLEFTGEYNDYEDKGHWEYYDVDGQQHSTYVRPQRHDPVYEKVPGHYECPHCSFKDI